MIAIDVGRINWGCKVLNEINFTLFNQANPGGAGISGHRGFFNRESQWGNVRRKKIIHLWLAAKSTKSNRGISGVRKYLLKLVIPPCNTFYVINGVMNKDLYNFRRNPTILMYSDFNGGIFVSFQLLWQMFIRDIEGRLWGTLRRHRWRHHDNE